MIQNTQFFYYLFGALTAIGGLMGYLKAGSKPSLIAGGISGLLLVLAGFLLMTYPARPLIGLSLGLLVTLALLGRFAPAFLEKHKMMPAGMICILGLISLVLSVAALLRK